MPEVSQSVEISPSKPKFLKKYLKGSWILLLVLAALWVILSIATHTFFTYNNLFNLGRQTAINGVIALGMTFVIVTGGIDISVGSIVAIDSLFLALVLRAGIPIPLSIALVALLSIVLGLINGIVIFDGNVPPFIATMGMMIVARGIGMVISQARLITGLPMGFINFAQEAPCGIPSLVIVLAVMAVICGFILHKTSFGRSIYALGSSREATRLSGINIRFITYGAYAICAFMSGIAAILLTSRLASGIPTAGEGYELDAIAAAVVGGASLNGAEGSIIGTILGAFIMSTLRNGGNLLGLDPFYLQIVIGILLVATVIVDQIQKRK
jgi:ribose/xylose/arabinose/galactoside ABC-type transport system permease subunit